MIRELSAEEKTVVLESLTKVGKGKCVGYLPIQAIEKFLKRSPIAVKESLEKNNIGIEIIDAEECCITSGALYAYDRGALERILQENQGVLISEGWPTEPRQFILRIARDWIDESHPVHPIISRVFEDNLPKS